MNEYQEVGQRIAELRGQMTKQDFSARLGVDRKTVERWEAGERLPDGSKLLKLMMEFGADVNYILTGQRVGSATTAPASAQAISRGDRILLDNFHAAPEQVQAGVKTALGAFAPAGAKAKHGKAA